MAKYSVEVSRACSHTFEVEADDCKQAIAKAEQLAYDRNWSGDEADYKVDSVLRRK